MQPRAEPGTWQDAPAFTVVQQEDGIDLQVVSPLARVRFITTPRQLPAIAELKPRLDSSLKGSNVSEAQLEEVCARAVAASAGGTTALDAYMQARAELEGLFTSDVSVAFTGVEGGRAEVLVKAVKPGDLPFVSGGWGGAGTGAAGQQGLRWGLQGAHAWSDVLRRMLASSRVGCCSHLVRYSQSACA